MRRVLCRFLGVGMPYAPTGHAYRRLLLFLLLLLLLLLVPSLRVTFPATAMLTIVPMPPVITPATPALIRAERPLSRPTHPPCKRICLTAHQRPSLDVQLYSAFAASRSSTHAVHPAANSPRLVHDPGGGCLFDYRDCRWLHPRPRLARRGHSFIPSFVCHGQSVPTPII